MKKLKRLIAKITVVLTASFSLTVTACKEKTIAIDEYPQEVQTVEDDEDLIKENTPDTQNESESQNRALTDAQLKALLDSPDPFEKGTFSFNIKCIPYYMAKKYQDHPEIIMNALAYIEAVYNQDSEFEMPPEDVLDIDGYIHAMELAEMANPMVSAVRLDTEDFIHYKVVYLPKYTAVQNEETGFIDIMPAEAEDQDEAKKVIGDFVDYVCETVNKNVSADDSDIEKARAVYEALANDIGIVDLEKYTDPTIIYSDDMEELANRRTIVEGTLDKKLDQMEIARLYRFILSQLNIECYAVQASGTYYKQDDEKLDAFMKDAYLNYWNVVVADGKAYNCDLFYEIAILDTQRNENPNATADMTYFGMSDETRKKSFNVSKSSLKTLNTYMFEDQPSDVIIPECLEDYHRE